MFKKLALVLLGFAFLFLGARSVHAEVLINEVQLSPTGERFIELYNSGGSPIDLTGWYIQRKTATGSDFGSLVSNTNFEGKTINAHGYFVISRSSLNNSNIILSSLTLTESNTVQIKNLSQEVVDKIGWGDGCDSSCAPNPTDGESIQRDQGGSLITATPTPGVANENVSVAKTSFDTNTTNGENISTQDTSEPKQKATEVSTTMKVKILANTLAFTGQPLKMKTNIFGYSNENVVLGRAYWNFGDGSSLEQINKFEEFYHTYYYPGEYAVFLEYYAGPFSKVPEASNKMTIKVLSTTVTISKVGDQKDFFIELSNSASSDIDISNWVINSNGKIFILPKNSVIMSKKLMTIPGKITGFAYGDQSNLKLFSSTGELIFDYSASIVPTKILHTNAVQSGISVNQDQTNSATVKEPEGTPNPDQQINFDNNLSASVSSSDTTKDHPIRTYIFALISTIFIGVCAGVVYFIRRKKTIIKAGDDFKILDQ